MELATKIGPLYKSLEVAYYQNGCVCGGVIPTLKGVGITCTVVTKKRIMTLLLPIMRKDCVKGLMIPTSQATVVETEGTRLMCCPSASKKYFVIALWLMMMMLITFARTSWIREKTRPRAGDIL